MFRAGGDVNQWYSSLEGRPGVRQELTWLRESWLEPSVFWSALLEHNQIRTGLPLSSVPGVRYDLAHDLVLRYQGSSQVVLRWFDRGEGWRDLTYAELARQAVALAREWRRSGLEAGQNVALVLPFGSEFVVAMAACLLVGARFAFLPPGGEAYLARRLEGLSPAFITTRAPRSLLPESFQGVTLLEPTPGGAPTATVPEDLAPGAGRLGREPLRRSTVASGEPAWLAFPTRLEPIVTPLPVPADPAFLYPLRDGWLAFGLEPGAHLAAPGLPQMQHQPALLLCAMAWGATFVHLEVEDVLQEPSLLERFPLKSLGVARALRDGLLAGSPRPLRGIRHWFVSPEAPMEAAVWSHFIEACQMQEVPVSHQVVDAAWGGCLLSSRRQAGATHRLMLAPAGVPWALHHLPDGSEPPADRAGLFAPASPFDLPATLPPHLWMVRQGDDLFYGAPLEPRRLGRVYPAAEVIAQLEGLPDLEGACIVPEHGGSAGATRFTLLAFTGSRGPEAGSSRAILLRQAIELRVRSGLTVDHLPDRIVLVPLYPRREKGAVDAAWCRFQLESGLLARKIDHPAYRALTRLRGLMERSSPQPPPDAGGDERWP